VAFIQATVEGGDARLRWVQVYPTEPGELCGECGRPVADPPYWRWRRMNIDRIIEAESKSSFDSRAAAEAAAKKAAGNEGLDVYAVAHPAIHQGRVAGPPERRAE
jgi:hypothetical protein